MSPALDRLRALLHFLPRRFWGTLAALAVLLATGTVGYRLIEGGDWSLFDGFYMTAITLTTVGFLEVHPLSDAGRLFTAALAFGGVALFFFFATEFVRAVVSGELQDLLGKQRMERGLSEVRHHVIVVGYGRMGRFIAAEFEAQKVPFVVIDKDAGELEGFQARHGLALHGDATDDGVLRKAGIDRARALVAVTGEDADNLYVSLSARLLSDKLLIIARAEGAAAEAKLRKVGVNQVISPYLIGGMRVAQAVLRPAVIDFLDLALSREHMALKLEEVPLKVGSPLCGKTLADSRVRQDLEVIIVGIQRPRGGLLTNPPGDTVLEAGHTLIALGHSQQVDRLGRLAEGRE